MKPQPGPGCMGVPCLQDPEAWSVLPVQALVHLLGRRLTHSTAHDRCMDTANRRISPVVVSQPQMESTNERQLDNHDKQR